METIRERAIKYEREVAWHLDDHDVSYEAGERNMLEMACEWWMSRADKLGFSKYQVELFRKAMEGIE